jgi:hypothetical protein
MMDEKTLSVHEDKDYEHSVYENNNYEGWIQEKAAFMDEKGIVARYRVI